MSKLVPKLRFEEFSGEWEETKLGKVAEFIDSLHETPKEYVEQGYPMIRVTDIKDNGLDLNSCLKVTKNIYTQFTKRYKPSIDDIIFSRVGSCGESVLINFEQNICLGQNTVLLKPKYNSLYLFFYLKSDLTKEQVNKKVVGSSHKTLSIKDTKDFDIQLPCDKEQQKIANTLSSLDNLIESQNKKVEALKKHKKGLMQRLFPKEGERVPELRFDGVFGEWEEKSLKSVTIVNMGQSPASSSYNIDGKGIYLIQGNADIKNRISNPRQWTLEPTKLCNIGDLILTVRAPVGHIAKSMHKACIGRGVCSIMHKDNNNLEFIYQFLLSYEKKWVSLEQGSTFTAVSGNDIKSLKLRIPKPKEQQQIANTLSSLDTLIEAQNKKIETLKKHKKGLMQGLFVDKEEN